MRLWRAKWTWFDEARSSLHPNFFQYTELYPKQVDSSQNEIKTKFLLFKLIANFELLFLWKTRFYRGHRKTNWPRLSNTIDEKLS